MSHRGFYFSSETLRFILKLISSKQVEVCGKLIPDSSSGELLIYDLVEGSPEGYADSTTGETKLRGSCSTRRAPMIFHTHPYSSYSYPSFEDLNKVAKHTEIRTSIVATWWGIWEINRLSDLVKTIHRHSQVYELLQRRLGVYTKTSEEERKENPSMKSRDISQDELFYVVREYVNELNSLLSEYGLSITFSPWEQIMTSPDDSYLFKTNH
jgi:hypothetical protein